MRAVRFAAAVAALVTAMSSTSPSAQDAPVVTLKSFDGFTQLRGRLLDFDGAAFTIETPLGQIRVDALQVECEGEACPANLLFGAEFGIYGSNTLGSRLMPMLIEGYADTLDATVVAEVGQSTLASTLRIVADNGQEMAAIDIKSEGSSASYAALAQGTAAIGMSSRRARDRDIAVLRQAGVPDLRDTDDEHVIALDGLIAITHPSYPVKAISVEELAQVFSGLISNWASLGGRRGPINVYAPSDQTGTFQTFGSLVLAPSGALITQSARRFDRHSDLSDGVANDPSGIGVTGIAFQRAAKALPIRQSCGILSYPTTFAMKTEEYPLSRRLYLYTRPTGTPAHAEQLVDFALSDIAQPLIAEAGLVNQSVEAQSLDSQGARLVYAMTTDDEFSPNLMRQMLRELRDADRLSITFRFTPGASSLTPKSQIDVTKLAQDISSGFYEGREVMLVGFTDSVGQFGLNQGLAARRAGVVETELRGLIAPGALTGTQIRSVGYGELTPVGCNTTLQGRTANRRVEVWIRNL